MKHFSPHISGAAGLVISRPPGRGKISSVLPPVRLLPDKAPTASQESGQGCLGNFSTPWPGASALQVLVLTPPPSCLRSCLCHLSPARLVNVCALSPFPTTCYTFFCISPTSNKVSQSQGLGTFPSRGYWPAW